MKDLNFVITRGEMHELRTHLAVLQGTYEVLGSRASPETRALLEMQVRNTQKILAILDEVAAKTLPAAVVGRPHADH